MGIVVGRGSVSLRWWLNTQNVSFEFGKALRTTQDRRSAGRASYVRTTRSLFTMCALARLRMPSLLSSLLHFTQDTE